MGKPIFERMKELKEIRPISFHMPGHKGRNWLINWGEYILDMDITEIPGMDNLQDPVGVIKRSQELAAKAFGARETIYSVNGTTGGIYIALGGISSPGDKILIQRNSHKSVYNAAILNRLDIEYVYPNYNKDHHLYTGIDPDTIESKLKESPDIKVVVLTYPNYYGICSNIEKIGEIVHKYGKLLMIDEAHGSHFIFSDHLPTPALKAGADITVQSIHKTLPSFTQTSMVHIGSERVDVERIKAMSALYQTTSPSYLFMTSLELARAYMEGEGKERLDKVIQELKVLEKSLQEIPRVKVFTGDKDDKTIHSKDITKILFRIEGLTGVNTNKILMEDYNIYLEMADRHHALALTSVMNDREDFEALYKAIEDIASREYDYVDPMDIDIPMPKIERPIYEAFYSNKRAVDLKDSIGKISASFITPYPPGIPLICPGEKISRELVEYISFLKDKGIEIIGFMGYNKEKIQVID
ncbi:MAG: aminotransferase class I/II-fold pyridoxal phosphate-dependent enzyme [Tissierellia bacterium]|nr:aminotransferase class I/II-fold pyridoxal phosphate-dependent enzyme [Tissierellia bacterium]